jgi:hypothetical protein
MIATTTPKSTQPRRPHVFSTPVVREMPRPSEPLWHASTW